MHDHVSPKKGTRIPYGILSVYLSLTPCTASVNTLALLIQFAHVSHMHTVRFNSMINDFFQ